MKLYLRGHSDRYALEQLQLSLFPEAAMEYTETPFPAWEDGAVSTLSAGAVYLTASAKITLGGKTATAQRRIKKEEETVRLRRRILQQSYYLAALQLLPEAPQWGALAGVRPTKLTSKHLLAGGTRKTADALMRDTYFISPARRELCLDCSEATVRAASRIEPNDISLYVGIPFCPTRCAYCSFVSHAVEKHSDLLPRYLDALIREIEHTGKLLRASPYRLRSLYIGGGTPTTLSSEQMARLMDALAANFDLSHLIEYTVEGGRPDTLDAEKLRTIRAHGCDRMSINPQTMSDSVLKAIGRRHSTADVLAAYRDAVDAGFEGINMDLIAGLPGDSVESFAESLEKILGLAPTNITVHTLALKKGADLFHSRVGLPSQADVAAMLENTNARLRAEGYTPYYLYRQKYMSGSFENVGWCKPGFDGLYNIYMMEELHTVLSVGGGGMNKVNLPGGKIVRFHNPKYPKEYLDRLDIVLQEKEEIFDLLRKGNADVDRSSEAE
ncbi:MAG: coproporphyrinogen dehydrogenase HemZ [Oscillospiraceae bacterium]|nr:coproporphyrinogen dehydrogenase HemZ [Oscillospiraceae bacterium]